MKKNLVLIGMMGSGKTTIGKEISKKTDLKFVDTDQDPHNPMSIGLIGSAFPIFWNKFPVSIRDMLKLKNHFKFSCFKFSTNNCKCSIFFF